jgi:hypothetical protein
LTWENSDSIHAWSFGVAGRPKRWAIAQAAINALVDFDVICGPLSLKTSSGGALTAAGAVVVEADVVAVRVPGDPGDSQAVKAQQPGRSIIHARGSSLVIDLPRQQDDH